MGVPRVETMLPSSPRCQLRPRWSVRFLPAGGLTSMKALISKCQTEEERPVIRFSRLPRWILEGGNEPRRSNPPETHTRPPLLPLEPQEPKSMMRNLRVLGGVSLITLLIGLASLGCA